MKRGTERVPEIGGTKLLSVHFPRSYFISNRSKERGKERGKERIRFTCLASVNKEIADAIT